MTLPAVGICIPAYRDPEGITRLLAHLADVDYPRDRLHVVVGVDGGDAETVAAATRPGVTVLALDKGGSYASRNAAIDTLPDDVEIVVFTDADCEPDPQWIRGHVAAIAAGADLSGGAIDVTVSERPSPAEWVDKLRHLRQAENVQRMGYAVTANLAVHRRVLAQMRFDPRLQTGGDQEFCERAGAAGFRLVYTADAPVRHPARTTSRSVLKKVRRICGGMPARRERWAAMTMPAPAPRRWMLREARRAGISSGPLWKIRVIALDYRCSRLLTRSAEQMGATVIRQSRRKVRGKPVVAYLVDRYPQPTQTFITNEIAELRTQGVHVVVVRCWTGTAPTTDPDVITLEWFDGNGPRMRMFRRLWRLRAPRRYRRFQEVVRSLPGEFRGSGHAEHQVDWRVLPWLARRLQRRGVTRIHAHFAWRGAAVGNALSTLTGIPWSMTLHANDIFSRQVNLPQKLAAADRLVTVCDYNAQWMREHLGVTRPIDLVICGVDVPEQVATSRDWDVVAVGRLVPKKGFDTLIEAVALLADRGRRVRTCIVGDGPEQQALEMSAERLGVAELVTFAGSRPHDNALEIIAAGRVFALPARIADNGDRDSMPVVVKEAMAAGVPVVATDAVGIPEMVDDTVGRLVPPKDPAALADAIQDILDLDAGAYADLGARARARVEERFTMSHQVGILRGILLGPAKESV